MGSIQILNAESHITKRSQITSKCWIPHYKNKSDIILQRGGLKELGNENSVKVITEVTQLIVEKRENA